MDLIVGWLFIVALFGMGMYGTWHSLTAREFTARSLVHGRAKYPYTPKWYHRAFHLMLSLLFLAAATLLIVGRLWKSD